jgi:SpoVK/Ycf46/Vps4 family AAA+-type ATPase
MGHQFSILLKETDTTFLASSNEVTKELPGGLYNYSNEMQGMYFYQQDLDKSIIILDETQTSVYNKIESFWDSRKDYQKLGIAHKRGYLLSGPPGTGKTTLVKYLMKELSSHGGIILELCNIGDLPDAIRAVRAINGSETKVMVYMEDVEEYNEEVLSTAMDGATSVDNVIFIGTTNYPDRVSKRLKDRPSRFDEVITIDYPNKDSRANFIKNIAKDLTDEDVNKIIDISDGMSQAHVKELIIQKIIYNKSSEDLESLSKEFKSVCEDWTEGNEDNNCNDARNGNRVKRSR